MLAGTPAAVDADEDPTDPRTLGPEPGESATVRLDEVVVWPSVGGRKPSASLRTTARRLLSP